MYTSPIREAVGAVIIPAIMFGFHRMADGFINGRRSPSLIATTYSRSIPDRLF
ncbi:MAG: hypothetical protein QXP58_02440 [Thermoprotei archaeon]